VGNLSIDYEVILIEMNYSLLIGKYCNREIKWAEHRICAHDWRIYVA